MSTAKAHLIVHRAAAMPGQAARVLRDNVGHGLGRLAHDLGRRLELIRWVLSDRGRRLHLVVSKAAGTVERMIGGRRSLMLVPVAIVTAVVVFVHVPLTDRAVVLPALLCVVLLLVRGRKNVIIEPFADHTQTDAKIVPGLSTLLIVELDRLHREINTDDETPAAVGIERLGGFGRGKARQQEAARFLIASADGLSHALDDAVASDARIEFGVFKLPIGAILSIANRMVAGRRVIGGVHRSEPGGAPVLTAQLVGGRNSRSWRVDAPGTGGEPCMHQNCLDGMVRELAYQMFTDLSFDGTARWKAVRAFAKYLRLYRQSDHARTLKKAEDQLLGALAEDPNFGLAYYNLGVVYSRLAHAGGTVEPAAQLVVRAHTLDPDALANARKEAARVAFWNAIEKAPGLWQAHYALAVTKFETLDPIAVDQPLKTGEIQAEKQIERLVQVVRGCDRALELCPRRASSSVAVIRDLRGMAEVRLGGQAPHGDGFSAGISDHRAAVAKSWKEVCRAERLKRANRYPGDSGAKEAIDNAAAALHNLALAYARRAMTSAEHSPWDYAVADSIFDAANWAARAVPERPVASWFERAVMLDQRAKELWERNELEDAAHMFAEAAEAYGEAADIKPTHAEYAACAARALARQAKVLALNCADEDGITKVEAAVDGYARTALYEIEPALRGCMSPSTRATRSQECKSTLTALEQTYRLLDDQAGAARITDLRRLHEALEHAGKVLTSSGVSPGQRHQELSAEITRLEALRDVRLPANGASQRGATRENSAEIVPREDPDLGSEQLEMCLARLHAAIGDWPTAQDKLKTLIEHSDGSMRRDTERIVDFGLRTEYARALRHTDRPEDALREIAHCMHSHPFWVEAHREAARIHYALGRYDEALSCWEQALGLSPNDAYANLKAAICHRQVAVCHRRDVNDADEALARETALAAAAEHVDTALMLFDNEDSTGAAWARVWGGRIALERDRIGESVARLTGALDGPAATAAYLFLGEARLRSGAVDLAQAAFNSCAAGVDRNRHGQGRADFAFQLRRELIGCRVHCGLAQCQLAQAGKRADSATVAAVEASVERAAAYATRLVKDKQLKLECDALLAETRAAAGRQGGGRGGAYLGGGLGKSGGRTGRSTCASGPRRRGTAGVRGRAG